MARPFDARQAAITPYEQPKKNGGGLSRRKLLLAFAIIPSAVVTANLLSGCSNLESRLGILPGEIIEGGSILESKADLVKLIQQRQQGNQPILFDSDTQRLDSEDSATILKSTAYLTMIQNGLSPNVARLRANAIRLADQSDIQVGFGYTSVSRGPEKLGIVLAKDFFDPNANHSLIDAVGLVAHEAIHASPDLISGDTANQNFGILGRFKQTDPRWGFVGNQDYPNDLLRKLIEFPETQRGIRAEEFAAESGRVTFLLSLNALPDNTGLNLSPTDIYNNNFEPFKDPLRYLRANDILHLNAQTLTPDQITAFHQNNDSAGFFLELGREILANNKVTDHSSLPDEGDIRALGLVVFTGFVSLSELEQDRSKTGIINNSILLPLTDRALTPDIINQLAQLLVATI